LLCCCSFAIDNTASNDKLTVDYSTQVDTGCVKIEPITQSVNFEKGFNTRQYYLLVQDWLEKKYPNAFGEKAWATVYFFRVLAEYVYSTGGRLDPEFFNTVCTGREVFFRINYFIQNLEVSDDIKYALTKLYAFASIYARVISSEKEIVAKLSLIPKGSVLYLIPEMDQPLYAAEFPQLSSKELPNTSAGGVVFGRYVATEFGANLYYICVDHYVNFLSLPPATKQKIIEDIYTFNPTLIRAPDIRINYYFVTYIYRYIKNLIFPNPNPPLLKYALRGEINWLILPKTLDKYISGKNG